jgi:hypothetical protein
MEEGRKNTPSLVSCSKVWKDTSSTWGKKRKVKQIFALDPNLAHHTLIPILHFSPNIKTASGTFQTPEWYP